MSEDRDDDKVVPLHDREDATLSALYARASREQPPAELDARILRAAQGTVQSVVNEKRKRPRWPAVAGGLAASLLVMVLAVQLLPQAQIDADRLDAEQTSQRHPDAAAEVQTPTTTKARPVTPAGAPAANVLQDGTPRQPDRAITAAPLAERRQQSADGPADALQRARSERRNLSADTAREETLSSGESLAAEPAVSADTAAASAGESDDPRHPHFQAIAQLWRDGQQAAATIAFREFHRDHPDYRPVQRDQVVYASLLASLQRPAPQ